MDNANLLNIRCLLESLITRREAMIAENLFRVSNGESPAYGEDAFLNLSQEIDGLRLMIY